MANTINCPVCGKLTDSRLDSCPHCGAFLKRRSVQAGAHASKARKTCPQCRALVEEGDIICVACGTNLLTGQKIVEEAAARAGRGRMPAGWLVAGGVAAIVLIVVGMFWLYVATSDPVNKALRLIQAREYLEAQTILEAYVERAPDDTEAFYELGRLEWRTGNYRSAAESFARAIEPSNPDAGLWAVAALSRSGSSTLGQQAGLLERVAETRRNDPGVWYLLALARGAKGDAEGQIEALEKVLKLRPKDASARWSIGVAHALRGDYDDAQDDLSQAADGPRKANALAAIGFVSNLKGAEDAASRHFSEALEVEGLSASWQTLTELGELVMHTGRFAQAQQFFEQALTIRPAIPKARYLRAVCLQARGRLKDAVTEFEAVWRERGAYAMDASVQTAQAYLAMNTPDRARQAIDQAARLGGAGAPYLTIRGRVFAQEGDVDTAFESFRRAINTNPQFAPAYLERGLLHVRQDDVSKGLRDLERYLELVGNDTAGTRVSDIRALADQLRKTAARAPGGPRNAVRFGGSRA